MKENILVLFKFGEFGNYGAQLVVKTEDGFPLLALENWAYGETNARVVVHEGVSSKNIAQLGKELIQAALKLEEIERNAK